MPILFKRFGGFHYIVYEGELGRRTRVSAQEGLKRWAVKMLPEFIRFGVKVRRLSKGVLRTIPCARREDATPYFSNSILFVIEDDPALS
jgi:hypothetical protein